jgi:hypothetical protein
VRTTLTLDEDVARLLNKEVRRNQTSFKQAVNHYLRLGLMVSKQPPRKPFVVKPMNLELPPGLSYDNAEELLDYLEGPYRR